MNNQIITFTVDAHQATPKLFREVFLAEKIEYTDFVWNMNRWENKGVCLARVKEYQYRGTRVGRYFSATTAMPWEKMKERRGVNQTALRIIEDVEPAWILDVSWSKDKPDRKFLDITNPDCRARVIEVAVTLARDEGYNSVSWDNLQCLINPWGTNNDFPINEEDWTGGCLNFIKESTIASHAYGLKNVVNVACFADMIPAMLDIVSLTGVDAIMTEMAFHKNMRDAKYLIPELDAYRRTVANRTSVYIIKVPDKGEKEVRIEEENLMYVMIRGIAKEYPGMILAAPTGTIHFNDRAII